MKPVSYGTIKQTIQGSKAIKKFKDSFTNILEQFCSYPDAMDITLYGVFKFHIVLKEYEDTKEIEKPVSFHTRVLAAKDCTNVKEYLQIVLKHIYSDVAHSFNEYCNDCERWIELEKISLADEGDNEYYPPHQVCISEFISWTDSDVGIWYVEQECGEHWIKLPKNWKPDSPLFHTEIDRKLETTK